VETLHCISRRLVSSLVRCSDSTLCRSETRTARQAGIGPMYTLMRRAIGVRYRVVVFTEVEPQSNTVLSDVQTITKHGSRRIRSTKSHERPLEQQEVKVI